MFNICSFCLAMAFYVKAGFVSGLFFGEPPYPFDE
jgi:hypothetical protein